MKKDFKAVEFILYVENQQISRNFYKNLFQIEPTLDVAGMTEFELFNQVKLGLMPYSGIYKILQPQLPSPQTGKGIPRAELYLEVADISVYLPRIANLKVTVVSELSVRDWGAKVIYLSDPDTHIIALAEKI